MAGVKKSRLILGLVIVSACALAGRALWLEPAGLDLDRRTLHLDQLPIECGGLRVALIADLHVGSPFNGLGKLDRVVALTNEAEPDLILLLGDYVIQGVVGGTFVEPETLAARLGTLAAPLGVFAVLGNHDWWFDAPRVRAAFLAEGVVVLEDSAVAIDGCGLWLAGISDFWEGAHDVVTAFGEVPSTAPVIVFTHNPDVFPDIPDRALLTVAGHTHGGQVRLPFVGRPVVPSRFGQRFAAGHVNEDGRDLFVSTGVGTSILPVRFRVPPVVTLLTLEARAPAHGGVR